MKRIFRIGEFLPGMGMGRTQFYEHIKEKRFPPGIRLSENAVGWLESEVNALISALAAEFTHEQLCELTTQLIAARKTNAPTIIEDQKDVI